MTLLTTLLKEKTLSEFEPIPLIICNVIVCKYKMIVYCDVKNSTH